MEEEIKKEPILIRPKNFNPSEEQVGEWTPEGKYRLKEEKKVKRGSKSRTSGATFELRVRKDLEEKGWIVDKWTSNIDLEKRTLIPVKRKFMHFKKNKGFVTEKTNIMTIGTGFPDFIAFQLMDGKENYKVIGVEVKVNGKLSKTEKEKCRWYLEKKIFSKILIAKKVKEKNRVKVVYEEFRA